MPRRTNGTRLNLQEAIALLIHNQAAFVNQIAETNKRLEETARLHAELEAETRRHFAAIERELYEIKRALHELPEAIRQKIGFKAKQ
jgi:predicted  nucleic acid-binding Zn-ribbon protein